MRIPLSIFLFLITSTLFGQKSSYDILSANNLEKIVFSSDEVHKIIVTTVPGDEVKISSKTEGEYYNQISIDTEIVNNTLHLNSRFNEVLQNGYDKLSAHKVYAMTVELQVPEGISLSIDSNIASVYLTGIFESVLIELRTGSCYFDHFEGNAVVNTYEGNIFGDAKNFNLQAASRNGEVSFAKNMNGVHKMVLTSINGNIKLTETK